MVIESEKDCCLALITQVKKKVLYKRGILQLVLHEL
jgi:hypothetical protein